MSVWVVGVNAKFDAPRHVGLDAIASAAERADVILVVEAKHLPEHLGLDPTEWHVVHDMSTQGRAGVAAAFRKATMFVEDYKFHLGLGKNRHTLDRWVLTVKARRLQRNGRWGRVKRFRVTHLVPKRGWEFWDGQMARSLVGRWHILYSDFNKLDRAVRPALARAGKRGSRVFMKHIVGFAIKRGVRIGRTRAWRTPGMDHDITATEMWPDRK